MILFEDAVHQTPTFLQRLLYDKVRVFGPPEPVVLFIHVPVQVKITLVQEPDLIDIDLTRLDMGKHLLAELHSLVAIWLRKRLAGLNFVLKQLEDFMKDSLN